MAIKDAEKRPASMQHVRELSDEELTVELGRLQDAQFRLKFLLNHLSSLLRSTQDV